MLHVERGNACRAEKSKIISSKTKHQTERVDDISESHVSIEGDIMPNTEMQSENSPQREKHGHWKRKLKKVLTVYQKQLR